MTTNESRDQPATMQPLSPVTSLPGPAFNKLAFVAPGIAVICLGLAILWGINSRLAEESKLRHAAQASGIPYVEVIYPKVGYDADEILLPGNTQAFNDTPIYARTSGYVKKWYSDIGSHVRQGQLLALIESPEVDQQLQQARANLENAQVNLQLAQITATRWQRLLESAAVSRQETDQAVSDLHSKQALVKSSKASVERLEQLQEYERVTAPFDGIVTARNTDIGALVQADQSSNSKELFHLVSIKVLRVYVPVPESAAGLVKTGEKVKVNLISFPGEPFTGTIARSASAIDVSSRTLNVEVDIGNPTGRLLPGAYAFVRLPVPPAAGAVTIPSNALLFRAEGLRTGVVHDGHVKLTPITIGQDYGSAVEVISGLKPRDAVIVNPSDSLADGDAVQIATQNDLRAKQ